MAVAALSLTLPGMIAGKEADIRLVCMVDLVTGCSLLSDTVMSSQLIRHLYFSVDQIKLFSFLY